MPTLKRAALNMNNKKTHTQLIKATNISLQIFQKICQCVIKLQTEIQITQQHNKSKLKI